MLKILGREEVQKSEAFDLTKPHMRIGGFLDDSKKKRFSWIIQGGRVWELGSNKFLGSVSKILKDKLSQSLKDFDHSMCELCGRVFTSNSGETGLEGHLYFDHRDILITSLATAGGKTVMAAPSEESILREAELVAGLVPEPTPEKNPDRTTPNFSKWKEGKLVEEK